MKIYIISAFVLCSVFQSYAQDRDEKLFYQQRLEKFNRIKKVGVSLTAIGGIAIILGLALNAEENHDNLSTGPNSGQKDNEGLSNGEKVIIGGLFLAGPGVPLWIIGGNGESKYSEKLRTVSIRSNVNQKQVSITLAYRF